MNAWRRTKETFRGFYNIVPLWMTLIYKMSNKSGVREKQVNKCKPMYYIISNQHARIVT